MILSDISRENKRVAARLLQLDKKGHKNKHFRMLESADITLVAAAGFEPTTFGLWVLNIQFYNLRALIILADIQPFSNISYSMIYIKYISIFVAITEI